MSELLQLLTMKPHPVVGARLVGESYDDKSGFVFCSKCNRDELVLEDFYIRPSGRPASWCKDCTKEYKRLALRAKKEKTLRETARHTEYIARKAA